jgi:hypothetical protein
MHAERSYGGPEYVVSLRQALDAAGFNHTRIVVPDGGLGDVVTAAEANATFAAAFDVVGLHYPCDDPQPAVVNGLGKRYWASEDWWCNPDWAGAGCWGRRLNRGCVIGGRRLPP